MSNRTVNLKDVAAKAGVSITTVSHVINKTRFVKPETTAAVESAIKDVGQLHLRQRSGHGVLHAGQRKGCRQSTGTRSAVQTETQ